MKFINDIRRNNILLLLTLPAVIWFILFAYMPMFGIIIAFKRMDYSLGIFGSEWVGLKNFEFIFKSQDAFTITRNTILYNLVWIPLGTAAAVAFAIMYDALSRKKVNVVNKINQTLSIMPYFLSWVVVVYFAESLLNVDKGFLNKTISLFGGQPLNWYAEPKYWPFILTITNLWKTVGYSSIVYYASIRGFSNEYYEAAWIDGANWYQQVRYITLPLLKPILTIMLTLAIGGILGSDFGLFYIIPKNSGMLYSTTSTIDTYIYNGMTSGGDLGMTGAVNFYKSVVGFVLVVITTAFVRRHSKENALF